MTMKIFSGPDILYRHNQSLAERFPFNLRERVKRQIQSQELGLGMVTRSVTVEDVSRLRRLEVEKWGKEGASEYTLTRRIQNTPGFCWATFDSRGEALASCFVMGTTKQKILASKDWYETTDDGTASSHEASSLHWFGISLSSKSEHALADIAIYMALEVLRKGIRAVYLGSPMPGFARWKQANPMGTAMQYVTSWNLTKGKRLHIDPLLRSYVKAGFEIVDVLPNYFPHARSLNWGALICIRNWLWFASGLFKLVSKSMFRRNVMPLMSCH
ncbi:MAG: hypothetical protein JO071_14970 [Deltaproteobacteria bacterium]|nr:hypothetical protein [Deltaproteobacteria bacterium]